MAIGGRKTARSANGLLVNIKLSSMPGPVIANQTDTICPPQVLAAIAFARVYVAWYF
jgi:hypothetical protein